jgi:predicted amidohydrolase
VIFDVGTAEALPVARRGAAMKAGFLPDSISTDLHISSMNAA